ncbi:MAG: AAA family ATPase [Burkholderiales bacterium]|nr:AAA family ATPase [Burkholderiales bacterium]
MFIESVSIENYKSFEGRQTFDFDSGFNLLVGVNNSGKTSVLDVLDMNEQLNVPHRSIDSIPVYGAVPLNDQSALTVSIVTNFAEIQLLSGGKYFYLPVSWKADSNFDYSRSVVDEVWRVVSANSPINLTSIFGGEKNACQLRVGSVISDVVNLISNDAIRAAYVPRDNSSADRISVSNFGGISGEIRSFRDGFKKRIYRFSAQRRPGTECAALGSSVLDREAAGLPYCINHLQTNDSHAHELLCNWVQRVFPGIKWIQATPLGSIFQLRCLPHSPSLRRNDLATPMAAMGSGIGNVVAMLYVVLTSRDPQVIAIDEPNAFLHPKALRELMAILETEGGQHQFIVTAHSPDVLTAVRAKSISILKFDGCLTTVISVGSKDLGETRASLAELGISVSDLHAKDGVIWVEGQTEELVLPDLIRWACPEVSAGLAVLRVERTGAFSKKGVPPEEVAKIYKRLSTTSGLVPPMIGIVLDRENRKDGDIQEIERSSGGVMKFLDRRMLENYLLHPLAISKVLAGLGVVVGEIEIAKKISESLATTGDNEKTADGAQIISDIFSSVTEAAHEFRKTRDVPNIVASIIGCDPHFLMPMRAFLRNLCKLPLN